MHRAQQRTEPAPPGPTPNSRRRGSCPRASGRGDLQPWLQHSLRTRGQISQREKVEEQLFSSASAGGGASQVSGWSPPHSPHPPRSLGREVAGAGPNLPGDSGEHAQAPPLGPLLPQTPPPASPALPPRPASARCSRDSDCVHNNAHRFPR